MVLGLETCGNAKAGGWFGTKLGFDSKIGGSKFIEAAGWWKLLKWRFWTEWRAREAAVWFGVADLVSGTAHHQGVGRCWRSGSESPN